MVPYQANPKQGVRDLLQNKKAKTYEPGDRKKLLQETTNSAGKKFSENIKLPDNNANGLEAGSLVTH